jgi:hypothetical protein
MMPKELQRGNPLKGRPGDVPKLADHFGGYEGTLTWEKKSEDNRPRFSSRYLGMDERRESR